MAGAGSRQAVLVLAVCLICTCSARAQSSSQLQQQSLDAGCEEADLLAAVAPAPASDKPAIITIGDSITAFGSQPDGWVTKLANTYNAAAQVLNKGVHMGSTRRGLQLAKAVTQQLFPGEAARRVKLVTICFGANDASTRRQDEAWRMVPLAEFKANLQTMVDTLKAAGIANVLLITPPPAASTRVDRRLAVTGEYAAAVKEVAQKARLPVADAFAAIQADKGWEAALLLPDGLHLTARGNEAVYWAVINAIAQKLPAVSPVALKRGRGAKA